MTETTLRRALDGARVVEFAEGRSEFVAWHGGTTYNVYSAFDGEIHETTCFNVSDEKGRPLEADEARQHAREWLEQRADAHQ